MKTLNAKSIAEEARRQLAEVSTLTPDTVSAISRKDDGWLVDVEMIELKRIPNGQDVLATYKVVLDESGGLVSYERTKRYVREETSGLYE